VAVRVKFGYPGNYGTMRSLKESSSTGSVEYASKDNGERRETRIRNVRIRVIIFASIFIVFVNSSIINVCANDAWFL